MRRAREGPPREGCPPEPPGWLLEARGNARPRGMIVGAALGDQIAQQNSAYAPCVDFGGRTRGSGPRVAVVTSLILWPQTNKCQHIAH